MQTIIRLLLSFTLMVLPSILYAQTHEQASTVVAFGAWQIIKLLLIFFGILCLIIVSAYALKKFSMVSWTQGPIKILTGLSLSTKERIILIDVGGKQILLGVSPAGIESLHAFDEPVMSTQPEIAKISLFQSIYNKTKLDESRQ